MSSFERKVPVFKSDHNLIDSEFSSIRERFENEMKKMEEEMNRFRSQLTDRERDFFSSSRKNQFNETTTHTSSTTTKTSSSNDFGRGDFTGFGTSSRPSTNFGTSREFSNWLDDINSPLIQDTNDGKVLKLRFDLTQYTPEEIVVKTVDNKLQVQAKHDEKSEARSVYREYNREFLLPQGVNPELIRSSLSRDGVLTVEAPLPALEAQERKIPIRHG